MLAKFWETLGTKLAERWAALVAPASAFWGVGLLLWIERGGNLGRLRHRFAGESSVVQLLVLGSGLVVVLGSAAVVQWFSLPVLRLLEGYWPDGWPCGALRSRLAERRWQELEHLRVEWQELAASRPDWDRRPQPGEPAADRSERARRARRYAEIDDERRRAPAQFAAMRATRIGNTLAAAETRPADKYGLDCITCWPALWSVLPADARSALAEARRSLDAGAVAIIWATLGLGLAVFTLWAVPAAIVVMFGAYLHLARAASGYGMLVESAFDVHRVKLYEALRMPLPASPTHEVALGRRLTAHLLRGGGSFTYTNPAKPKGST